MALGVSHLQLIRRQEQLLQLEHHSRVHWNCTYVYLSKIACLHAEAMSTLLLQNDLKILAAMLKCFTPLNIPDCTTCGYILYMHPSVQFSLNIPGIFSKLVMHVSCILRTVP